MDWLYDHVTRQLTLTLFKGCAAPTALDAVGVTHSTLADDGACDEHWDRTVLHLHNVTGAPIALYYSEDSDVLYVLFSDPPTGREAMQEVIYGAFHLTKTTTTQGTQRITALSISDGDAHCDTELLPQQHRALWDAMEERITAAHGRGARLQASGRDVFKSACAQWPKHHTPNCCDYCLLFFEGDGDSNRGEMDYMQCLFCEECVTFCARCAELALMRELNGYACLACGSARRKQLKEKRADDHATIITAALELNKRAKEGQ